MVEKSASTERLLLDLCDGEECRTVSVIAGTSLAVLEKTGGPLTEVAYGTRLHGHKLLCSYDACARVLGVTAQEKVLYAALARFFVLDETGDAALLSDLMDRFDTAGERYTYAAWSSDGNAVFRPGGAA